MQRRVRALGEQLGRPLKFLVGKPGLDGHSNGAEQIAVRARDAGFEVVYSGIRLTPAQIVAAAVEEDVDVVGLSILSGSHLSVVPDVLDGLRAAGLDDVPVIAGGIIPEADAATLRDVGRGAGLHAQGLRDHRRAGPDRRRDRGSPRLRHGLPRSRRATDQRWVLRLRLTIGITMAAAMTWAVISVSLLDVAVALANTSGTKEATVSATALTR